MSLDYSPEVMRQHNDWKERRLRLNGPIKKPIVETKPVPEVVVLPPVEKTVELVPEIHERDWLIVADDQPHSVAEICKEVCRQFDIRHIDLISRRKTSAIIKPRQIAMALALRLTKKSSPQIGRLMGDKDHATVLHAGKRLKPVVDEVEARLSINAPIEVWVMAVRAEMLVTPSASSSNYKPVSKKSKSVCAV